MINKSKVMLLTASFLLLFLTAGTLMAQASTLIAPRYEQVRWEVSALIEEQMPRRGTGGVSVAVVDDQRIVWAEGFRATPETIYPLASLTKAFTAFSAMQLVERKKLDLDRPLQAYLLPSSPQKPYPQAGFMTTRTILLNQPTKPPAMAVLGEAISAISGTPYPAHIRKTLLEPLGMEHSFYGKEPEHSTGLYSSVLDLARFVEMIFADGSSNQRALLKKETLNELFQTPNERLALDGSFRIELGSMASGNMLQNSDTASIVIFPDYKLGVIVLSNAIDAKKIMDSIATETCKIIATVKRELTLPKDLVSVSALPATALANPEIRINIPEFKLTVLDSGRTIKNYDIALGTPYEQTPTGSFAIFDKLENPSWYPGANFSDRTPVPPGVDNPLGTRWMEFTPSYGIHGTNKGWDIGYAVSGGCIRMQDVDARELYTKVGLGTPVIVVYETLRLLEKADGLYLKVLPDIYAKHTSTQQVFRALYAPFAEAGFQLIRQVPFPLPPSDEPYEIKVAVHK